MKTFVANPKQTREFIANFKRVCYPLGAYNVTIDESVAIKRRLATFNTLSGKTFVVNVSDLNLVAVTCDVKEQIGAIAYMNNLGVFKAPEKEIYSTHIDDNSPTIDEVESLQASAKERFEDEQERAFSEWCNSTEDNSCFEAPEENDWFKDYSEWHNWATSDAERFAQAMIQQGETLPTNKAELRDFLLSDYTVEPLQDEAIYPYVTVYRKNGQDYGVFTFGETEDILLYAFTHPINTNWREYFSSKEDSHSIAPEKKLDNESSTSVDDDSLLSIDEVSDFITEINSSYTINQQETALKAAKIVFHYWALSGNSWNVPYDYDTIADLTNNLSKKLNRNIYITFVNEALNIGNAILNLRFLGDFLVLGDNLDLFLQMLDKHSVSCGVHPQFTPSQLSVYQQNYQAIVADCNTILELYREKEIIGGEYQFIPQNTKELHALITYIQDKSTADSIVESLKGEEYLFFQVLDTLNSINQTKPAMICA